MTTIRLAGCFATATLLVACAGMHGEVKTAASVPDAAPVAPVPASVAAPVPVETIATWYSPPGDFPGICMTQFKDGGLRFDGGFTFFNPASWSYDAASAELRLTLQPSAALPLLQVHADKAQHPNLLRVEADQHTLVYRVKADTKTIGLGGFVFYRDLPCPAGA